MWWVEAEQKSMGAVLSTELPTWKDTPRIEMQADLKKLKAIADSLLNGNIERDGTLVNGADLMLSAIAEIEELRLWKEQAQRFALGYQKQATIMRQPE